MAFEGMSDVSRSWTSQGKASFATSEIYPVAISQEQRQGAVRGSVVCRTDVTTRYSRRKDWMEVQGSTDSLPDGGPGA